MFLAGFLGNDEQWKQLACEWRAGLGQQRKTLHMRKLRWNTDGTRKLLARLGPIPHRCGLTPILSGIRYGDYEDLVSKSRAEKALAGYITCLTPLILQVLRVVPDGERLELVFENQRAYEPLANMAISTLMAEPCEWKASKDGTLKLAKWSFVPKGSTIMIDPADYFAFALRELWINKDSKKTLWCDPIMKPFDGNAIGFITKRNLIRDMVRSSIISAEYQRIVTAFGSKR